MLDPHHYLDMVHPDLVKVLQAAYAAGPQQFQIVYGLRTLEAEQRAVATGHSQTMHSRHLPNASYGGKCCAVDLWPIVGGLASACAGHEEAYFQPLAEQIEGAAQALGIDVEWGGTWSEDASKAAEAGHWHDWGHFQLKGSKYPYPWDHPSTN